ncbi:MAG: response regulator [Anaerolineae bacterium]|nr:response regulator [Anaerolineae bacterium]
MIDETAFVRHVKDALETLYDPVHLQVHPLTDILMLRRLPGETSGEALRKRLWEAVESLKPPASVPSQRPEWLSYRLLWLYYIQGIDRQAVQRDLGLAERTFYRRLQEAVEAVAGVLWESRQTDEPPNGRAEAPPAAAGPTQLARQKALRLIQAGHAQVVSLNAVAASAVETVLPLYRQRACALTLDIPADLPETCGDPAVLNQIIVNALLGALDVAGGGGLALHVSRLGGKVLWRVSGLNEARSPEALLTLNPITLSRELVQGCGGEFWIDRDARGVPELRLTMICVQPTTILVIDDDADARQLLSRLLGAHGYVVREAASAQVVPTILDDTSPDLILLDVLMPQQDGWKLLQRLKTHDETASIPVVICSVLSQVGLATALGAAAVVQKPVSEEVLIETVGRVLSLTGQVRHPAGNVAARA